MVGVKSLSSPCQAAFLTCNIGPLPLGVTLSPTSESCLLSEPLFSAEWQGGPVQPVPGRGARGPQWTWQVRVGKWASGLEDKLRLDKGTISLTSCLSSMALNGIPLREREASSLSLRCHRSLGTHTSWAVELWEGVGCWKGWSWKVWFLHLSAVWWHLEVRKPRDLP